jgi:hypothetical protein
LVVAFYEFSLGWRLLLSFFVVFPLLVLLGARLILRLQDPDPAHFNAYMWLVFLTLGGGGLLLSLGMLSGDAVGASVAPWIFLLGGTFFAHRPLVRQTQPWNTAPRTAWCVAMASVIACGAYACVLEAAHCPDSTYSIDSTALGQQTTLTCTGSTKWHGIRWSGTPASCVQAVATCTLPREDNGVWSASHTGTFTVGSTTSLTCNPGYRPSTNYRSTLTCGSTGRWIEGYAATCRFATCTLPREDNGVWSASPTGFFTAGSTTHLTCNPGYRPTSYPLCKGVVVWGTRTAVLFVLLLFVSLREVQSLTSTAATGRRGYTVLLADPLNL